ncbi:MAG: thioredoxin domain-containing protein [Planctomycetota bacterium]|nr:thioredoxin domain-containing protein [Planctomycetota bacterium]
MNRLQHETSPYLLQHQNNPVDWYPWGPEALGRARDENKPIFLSIGYSACHWCHVMEHESFENEQIASLMNQHFINIKVDREERPDLDAIYMQAVQLMTQRGGWPMSVFLTPDLQPFYGGTYYPPTARMGMPGFDQILLGVADFWQNKRDQVVAQAAELTGHLRASVTPAAGEIELSDQLLHAAGTELQRNFDARHGGFGGAPKFPHPMDLRLLARLSKRAMSVRGSQRDTLLQILTHTLDKMGAGGIYDQLGGGFHRYSVDERWLVPHFEKMLYDNALLINAYLDGYLVTGNAEYARIVRETIGYVLRDMNDPAGGFYSTEDADSEGHEGKVYVWTPAEIEQVLGADRAATFCYVYDVSEEGNFEETNILNLPKTLQQCAAIRKLDIETLKQQLAEDRCKLFGEREKRVRPGRDDKVLVAWNGLMIDALAQAATVLDEPRYLQAATAAADFILTQMRRTDGRLLHTWRGDVAKLDAYLDDYSCLINGLVSLYEASFNERFISAATELADQMLAHFSDLDGGGFFFTADDHEELIARQKDMQDSATPSGNSMAATALLRLGKLTGRTEYLTAAEGAIRAAATLMQRYPSAAGQMLLALDMYLGPTFELVLLADRSEKSTQTILAELHRRFIPNKVVALRDGTQVIPASGIRDEGPPAMPLDPLFAGRAQQNGQPTLYLCQDFACQEPVLGEQAILAVWERLSGVAARV